MVKDEDGLVVVGEEEVIDEVVGPAELHAADGDEVFGGEDSGDARVFRLEGVCVFLGRSAMRLLVGG